MKAIEKDKLIHKILQYYYIDNMTQLEISKKLNISRIKVIRFIDTAKKQGLVEVKLNIPIKDSYEIESLIEKKYSICECSIVPSYKNNNDIDKNISIELSNILKRLLKKDTYLGVSFSETLKNVVDHMHFNKKAEINVIPIIGGLELDGFSTNSNIITHLFAEKIGGRAFSINIPAVLDSKEAKEIIEKERHTIKMHALADKIEVVVAGVGNMNIHGTAFKSGYFTLSERNYLNSLGICGIINLNFIDKNGLEIKTEIDNRIVKIFPLEKLKKLKKVVVVAYGEHKVVPLVAALKGGIIDYMITDKKTAEKLI